MQLYVDRNRAKTEKLLGVINDLGLKAIFVTVDAAAPGKREADERSRAEVEVVSGLGSPSFVLPQPLLKMRRSEAAYYLGGTRLGYPYSVQSRWSGVV